MSKNKTINKSENLETARDKGVNSSDWLCVLLYWFSKFKKPFNALNSKASHSFDFPCPLHLIWTHVYIVGLIFVWTCVISPGNTEAFTFSCRQVMPEFHHSNFVMPDVVSEKLERGGAVVILSDIANRLEKLRMKFGSSYVESLDSENFESPVPASIFSGSSIALVFYENGMQIYNTVKGVKVSIKNGTIKRKRRGFGP